MTESRNTYRAEIRNTLRKLMRENDKIILVGQSIRDPYGGACKVTRGLTKEFGDRIIDMPICESATIGFAVGLALRGYIPIVEIMFADFLTLCVDQIWNVGLKLLRDGQKIIVRYMTNRDRLYGPTHSQCMSELVRSMESAGVVRYSELQRLIPLEKVYGSVILVEEVKQEYDEAYDG